MTESVRLVLVDDDPLVRAGLRMMLDGYAQIRVVGEAADGDEVPGLLDRHRADVVLMDLRMPRVDGIRATEAVRQRREAPEVLVLTTFDTDENVLLALRAGAAGFLLKDAPPQAIVDAIHRVAAGEPAMSPSITRRLIERVAAGADRTEAARRQLAALSPRETDVVLAVAGGATNAEIAAALFMSVATVKAHLTSIMAKLDLTNRTQIAILVHDAQLG